MEKLDHKRRGYIFRAYLNRITLIALILLLGFLIFQNIFRGSSMIFKIASDNTIIIIMVLIIVLYFILLWIINAIMKEFLKADIGKIVYNNNKATCIDVNDINFQDKLFYGNESKVFCFVDEYNKGLASIIYFPKSEVKSIKEKCQQRDAKQYQEKKMEYESALKKADYKYTIGGGLVGGVGGAFIGATMDSMRNNVPDDPSEKQEYSTDVGIEIELYNGYKRYFIFKNNVKVNDLQFALADVISKLNEIRSQCHFI